MGRVTGHMVATVKLGCFRGEKLLIVEPLDPEGRPDGPEVVACDRAGAGVGDLVLLLQEGGSCRAVMNKMDAPVEALVIAVIDRINL
ncbi:MAG TPA: EutN/CcmL family microcompartment protein [Symbiobacteriaceae bacterium]|nr:EutN/CcmL family microcompartment protein [Symbiobacteriaceae bacterium]